ncbi:MAG: 4-oxalocrotonate tautomerase [Angelakisella sp.]|jgi:predicted DNA binding CopG/RHH family protein|nr:4-oxalocrotonate tautomerase [Angelakisella sp.]
MAEKKNLCAPISPELHRKVQEEQERLGQTLGQYVERILREHFEGGEKDMNSKSRTLAFQVSEELFQKIKAYLAAHNGLSQKEFIVGLVEAALAEWEESTEE